MIVRQLEEKDLEFLPAIFDTAHDEYSMYSIKTPELCKYLLVDRPGIGEENIFVAEEENLLGYVAVRMNHIGSSTAITIYEMAALNKKAYDLLMKKVEEIGIEKDAAFIDFQIPQKGDLEAYIKDAGFIASQPVAIMIVLLDTKKILRIFVENALKTPFKNDITVLFCVGVERIQLKLPEGSIDSDSGTADIEIEISPHDLLSLFLIKSKCHTLILKRKMKVTPFYKMKSACEVIDYLSEDMKIVTLFEAFM
jgi:hypothetical protein